MKIAEAAAESDLSADTIRFYEREGLVGPIARSPDGHRAFSAKDLRWLRLFERLRSTGMPLNEMRRYAELARSGDATLALRKAMLVRHQHRLEHQQSRINACRTLIEEKIVLYTQQEEQSQKEQLP
ncbi:HTH-type transcriptional regulator AdhR [Pelagimonas phthalicica]|uniref:HTH-type transcriptional regulator AdhR n=1 Tax=Pelagimonas phthalicica TaxID=1037362 RepID=A0A238JJ78_9RHOB|nr:MerR family transcriptional regulator [Pelagimonas phthalicica]TDS89825.1 MerR family transcriptional regulator [Pelagimonas phthalicica]SMX29992.1 HTH-type transcriptional regulator AdhR [Pelagimonas phthalicica]